MNKKHVSKVGKYISMACLLFVCATVQSCRDEYYYDEDEEFFEVQCPECDEIITLDEEMLEEGEIECPECGTKLQFEFDTEDELDGE